MPLRNTVLQLLLGGLGGTEEIAACIKFVGRAIVDAMVHSSLDITPEGEELLSDVFDPVRLQYLDSVFNVTDAYEPVESCFDSDMDL